MSCLAEHGEAGPALGIAWDGTGYGADGTIWGGEFLIVNRTTWSRFGSLWPFPLVGGDRAARDPRRAAAGVCHAAGLPYPDTSGLTEGDRRILDAALARPGLAQTTTSAGRLFDAWASLLGLADRSTYEAEAAMRLEDLADPSVRDGYPVQLVEQGAAGGGTILRLDWRGWVAATLDQLARGTSPARLSAAFHNALVEGSLNMARRADLETIVLTGGCFQNRLLAERLCEGLEREGFRVLIHRRVPPGDGGLAAGQAWATMLQLSSS
jgi:hydrogenase maturation protein HypF